MKLDKIAEEIHRMPIFIVQGVSDLHCKLCKDSKALMKQKFCILAND